MAGRWHRFCRTAILGGGSIVLGVGLINYGLDYVDNSDRTLYRQHSCRCEPQNSQNEIPKKPFQLHKLDNAFSGNEDILEKARFLIKSFKEESGSPGLAVTVSIDGKTVWSEGFGYSDIENNVPCKPSSVMRVASISKPLTATATMKLVDEGKLRLDDPVQKYVSSFPEKEINSKPCTITIHHLLCHLSGIRHYHETKKEEKNSDKGKHGDKKSEKVPELKKQEYYIKECYDSVEKSLCLFKDDPLVHEPGSQFLYSTFGYTLLSAVIENAAQTKFLPFMCKLFQDLDMNNTQAELHQNLVYGRARHYVRNEKGQLINTPFVDNCYKWAGGGFISTTEDLLKFGNAMLYASQVAEYSETSKGRILSGIVSPESMRLSWTIIDKTRGKVRENWGYGLGWEILPEKHELGCCKKQDKTIVHTGAAVGASSILLILPESIKKNVTKNIIPPSGIVVAIIVNMESVSLRKPALKVAQLFKSYRTI